MEKRAGRNRMAGPLEPEPRMAANEREDKKPQLSADGEKGKEEERSIEDPFENEELKTLKRIGKTLYRGMDPISGIAIECEPGEVVVVSPPKAEQLGSDFPEDWEEASV